MLMKQCTYTFGVLFFIRSYLYERHTATPLLLKQGSTPLRGGQTLGAQTRLSLASQSFKSKRQVLKIHPPRAGKGKTWTEREHSSEMSGFKAVA